MQHQLFRFSGFLVSIGIMSVGILAGTTCRAAELCGLVVSVSRLPVADRLASWQTSLRVSEIAHTAKERMASADSGAGSWSRICGKVVFVQ